MTYFITALTNDKAQLIVIETQTTSAAIALMVAEQLTKDGYKVVTRKEA